MGIADSPLRDRVIFVEGAPRSGTTWLVTLLATHPEIAGVQAESHLFDYGVDRLFDNHDGRHPALRGLVRYVDRQELVDLARDFCDGALMAMRSRVCPGTTPPFVVEKTPISPVKDSFDLARKRECYPDAWYVHIVRDREAVVKSLMRAPWLPDRSYEACAALWDETVGRARELSSELPHYREVSYEDLRNDPVQTSKDLFEWLGVDTGESVLETVSVLSREKFSDLGAVSRPAATNGRAAVRQRLAGVRAALRERLVQDASDSEPPHPLTFTFVKAVWENDADALRALTAPDLELEYRSPELDVSLRGDEARSALAEIVDGVFARRYVVEWWGSTGVGPTEWWTTAPGRPFCTIVFSALGSDATRVNLSFGLLLEGNLIERAMVFSAGPLTGRPAVAQPEQ
jgi:hypothetical protein